MGKKTYFINILGDSVQQIKLPLVNTTMLALLLHQVVEVKLKL